MPRKTFFKIVITVILFGVLIFFNNFWAIKNIRNITVWIFEPLMGLAGATSKIFGGSGLSREYALNLIQENHRLKTANLELEKLKEENSSLKKIFGFKEEQRISLRGADVILYAQEMGKELLIIDQGKKDGISEGDVVVDENKILVGFIREVGNDFSKVSIASNPGETFAAELLPGKVRVVAKGIGGRALSLEFIPADAVVRKGDFVTLASHGSTDARFPTKSTYPFLLGEVVSNQLADTQVFRLIKAAYLARPELLDKVFVVLSPALK